MARAHTAVVAYDPVTNTVLTSATVNVYTPGTVTPISATLFDKNGNTLSNPLTADATTGLVDFYLSVAQEVDLVVSKASFTTRTYSNVPVLDDASNNLTSLLTTTGQIVYASGNNTPAALGIGSTGAFLTVTGGAPAWSNTIAAGGLSVTAGNVGIGVAPSSATSMTISGSITSGSSQSGIYANPTVSSAATGTVDGVASQPATAVAAFTCATLTDFHALNPTKGAGSTITNAYGLLVDAITVGGTNNYGIYINAPSGASADNFGLAVAGDCALGGSVIGSGVTTGATVGFVYIPLVAGTPTGVPARYGQTGAANSHGAMVFDTTNHKLYVYDGSWKTTTVFA